MRALWRARVRGQALVETGLMVSSLLLLSIAAILSAQMFFLTTPLAGITAMVCELYAETPAPDVYVWGGVHGGFRGYEVNLTLRNYSIVVSLPNTSVTLTPSDSGVLYLSRIPALFGHLIGQNIVCTGRMNYRIFVPLYGEVSISPHRSYTAYMRYDSY